MGGYAKYTHDYSFHQRSFFGTGYTGYNGGSADANTVASAVKNIVLWGSNALSTVNSSAYSEIRSVEMMKQRGGKVWFIGPEFVDTGVTLADTWYQMKPYTDTALILGMLYHAIDTTFDSNGDIKTGGLLDVNYIDTMVYGFFDSPAYWRISFGETYNSGSSIADEYKASNKYDGLIYFNKPDADFSMWDSGTTCWIKVKDTTEVEGGDPDPSYPINSVVTTKPDAELLEKRYYQESTQYHNSTDGLYTYDKPEIKEVNEVPAGKSLSAYIMGSDDRLTKAKYEGNYVATQFATKQANRNGSVCSYTSAAGDATKYQTKKDFLTPKKPAWASAITGIPEQAIKDLAELYFNPDNHPIYSEWCGAQQKQANGVINMFALQALLILSKTWGQTGDGLGRAFGGSRDSAKGTLSVSVSRPDVPKNPTTPVISCTQWHNAIKFAFKDQLAANGYNAKYIPDWDYASSESGVYYEDGGAKALYTWDREADGKIKTTADGYYQWKNGEDGKPLKAGFRFILNSGGNIPMNQHMDPNDAREMFEALDLGSTEPDNPDTFCMVSFDNFLSPSPRWSDYVLPAATTWEQEDIISISLGNSLYIPVVSNAPGQAKSQWNFTNDFLKAVGRLKGVGDELATKFTGGVPNQQIEDLVKEAFGKASVNSSSLYYGKKWEDFINNPYAPKTANEYAPVSVTKTTLRDNLDTYLSGDMSQAFVSNISTNEKAGYGAQWLQTTIDACPKSSGRFHVYSDSLVYCYEHRFEQWHGVLASQGLPTGQANKDFEGDPLVYPIPLYYAYEDYFNEAYGVMNGKNTLDMSKGYLLTTTHDRYRAHSSQSENAYLRELTHRIKGGGLYSGNDWNEYGNIGAAQEVKVGETASLTRLNQTIANGQPMAGKENVSSWSEVWMNDQDAAAEGIADGQLITIGNPVGDVRVIARVTDRVVRGFIGLHQGCWYDPDPVDGVDDGGCANTLMAQRPSRVDHGNGQQSAMVWIKNK